MPLMDLLVTVDLYEEIISELEYIKIETLKAENQKEQKLKKAEYNIQRHLQKM